MAKTYGSNQTKGSREKVGIAWVLRWEAQCEKAGKGNDLER